MPGPPSREYHPERAGRGLMVEWGVDKALRVVAEGESPTFWGESRPHEGGLGQELKSLRTHRGRARAR